MFEYRVMAGGGPDDEQVAKLLLVDTGFQAEAVISMESMNALALTIGPSAQSNFGPLLGGWVVANIPELGFRRAIHAYASDQVVNDVKSAWGAEFQGLIGLDFLRRFESWGKLPGMAGFHLTI